MKIKIIASLTIFLLLFSLAWFWEQENRREFYVYNETDEIIPFTVEYSTQIRKYKAFRPREYVRIDEF